MKNLQDIVFSPNVQYNELQEDKQACGRVRHDRKCRERRIILSYGSADNTLIGLK
jgi:hypothetical protein